MKLRPRTFRATVAACWLVVVGPLYAEQLYSIGPALIKEVTCDSPRVKGVVVDRRHYQSPLARAGVPVDAVIVEYGAYRITNPQEFIAAVDAYGTQPVDVKVLLPLQRGVERTRRLRMYTVTATPKRDQDVPREAVPPGRALVFCIVGPNKESSEYPSLRFNADCVASSIFSDPIAEQAEVQIFDEWQGDNSWRCVADALTRFCTEHKADRNDAVLVYFCGHGGYNPKRYQAEGHMLEFNTGGPGDPFRPGNHVWRGDLLDILPRHVRLRGLITECCFTDTTIDPDVLGKGTYKTWTEERIRTLPSTWQKLLLHSSGVVSLTSCSKDQKAWPDPSPPHLMLFTEGMIGASDQPVADWADFIQAARERTSQRFKEVRPRLPARDLDGQTDQVPQIFADEHRVTTRAVAPKAGYKEMITVSKWMMEK